MTRLRLMLALLSLLPLSLTGCDGCSDDEKTVPFKRDHEGDEPESPGEDAPKDASRDAQAVLPDATARTHRGRETLRLGEHELSLPGAHASFTLDLDADEQDDALIWAGGEDDTPVALWLARGSEEGFDEPRQLSRSSITLPESCEVAAAAFQRLGPDKAAVRTDLKCKQEDPARAHRYVLLLGLGKSPRVLERLAFRAGQHEQPLSLAEMATLDEDGDEHADVQLVLHSESLEGDLRMTWLDRPSGLSRDATEPENSLAALASAAQKQLESDPELAQKTAQAVLELHRQLCVESGQAVLSVADSWGLRCGRSQAAGSAALVSALALAQQGQVVEALGALQQLQRGDMALDAAQLKHAKEVLQGEAETPEWKLRPVAKVTLPAAEPALAPRIRLVGDDLWLGSQPPRQWNAATLTEAPSLDVEQRPVSFSDPSGNYRVRHIDRDCQGRLLRIAGPDDATHHVRVVQEPVQPGCKLRLPLPDPGPLRVLGWAPQGVVVGDEEGAVLVSLDARARPTDAPRRLSPSAPLPAPLPAGRAAPSGRCHVRPTDYGVLLTMHGREGGRHLVRPPGWEDLAGTPREAVVSADCSTLAVATRDQVFLIDRKPSADKPTAP